MNPRVATRADIPGMHRVRLAVRENRLTTTSVTEADYVPAIEQRGRGWVLGPVEVIAFAIALRDTASIWALFVDPAHEGCGHGGRLFDTALAWLFEAGCDPVVLNTEAGTRAERFYALRGGRNVGFDDNGEVVFEFRRPVSR